MFLLLLLLVELIVAIDHDSDMNVVFWHILVWMLDKAKSCICCRTYKLSGKITEMIFITKWTISRRKIKGIHNNEVGRNSSFWYQIWHQQNLCKIDTSNQFKSLLQFEIHPGFISKLIQKTFIHVRLYYFIKFHLSLRKTWSANVTKKSDLR